MRALLAGTGTSSVVEGRPDQRLLIALFLLASAMFLFVDGRPSPIVLWDESRVVVNALEMHRSGPGLITTFGFSPDLWNTKPPLMIWLMTASMALFGASEWALRLPSAIAALATLLILILFVRRVTGSLSTAFLAGVFLLLSPGFFGEHGARTADYDAVLLFFVTAGLQLLFFAVHRWRVSTGSVVAIGALFAAAAMTKSIAGLVPLAGVTVYLLATRRWRRALSSWRSYAIAAAVALTPLLLFYAVRESIGPGYLAAVLHNDFGGRFSHSLIGKATAPTLYIDEIASGWFFAGPLLAGLPLILTKVRGKSRALLLWSLCIAGTLIAIYSISSTRLVHYALPAFPSLAIVAALVVRGLFDRFVATASTGAERGVAAAIALIGLLLFGQLTARAVNWRFAAFPARQIYPQASYGALFEQLRTQGVSDVTVIDPGFPLEGRPGYTPLLDAYRMIAAEHGLTVRHSLTFAAAPRGLVASCEPSVVRRLETLGRDDGATEGCIAIRR